MSSSNRIHCPVKTGLGVQLLPDSVSNSNRIGCPVYPGFCIQQVAEIILAVGTGGYPAQPDFKATWDKLVEVFYKNKNDQRIVDLLYFELVAARLIIYFLACLDLRYKPINSSGAMLVQIFGDRTKSFLIESQSRYSVNLLDLFKYRMLSYSAAYEEADKDNKNTTVALIFLEYLSNSVKNRPLLFQLPNKEKPWLDRITSMNDIHSASQEDCKYCLAFATHMIDRADATFSSKVCDIVI